MLRSALVCVTLVMLLGDKPTKKPDPLPPLNEKVFEFAKASLGKPVGDGICITLAIEALREAGARPASFRDRKGDYEWGELVPDLKDVFHGQRSLGRGRTMRWHHEYPHHTAIVAKVEREGKLITIYHQNVTIKGKGESEKGNVQEGELRMESLQKGGWVKAYRPVTPDQATKRKPFSEEDGPGR
jgi:hypothetical protein